MILLPVIIVITGLFAWLVYRNASWRYFDLDGNAGGDRGDTTLVNTFRRRTPSPDGIELRDLGSPWVDENAPSVEEYAEAERVWEAF